MHEPFAVCRPVWRYLWPLPWSVLGVLAATVLWACGARARIHTGVLEVSGGWLGRWAARGVGPFKVVAITLGHVVLASSAEMLNGLRAHERVHVQQYERWGLLFVPAYLADSLWQTLRGRHPYRDNRFERPAFAAEAATPLLTASASASASADRRAWLAQQ
jgi:hypothetical protein